MCSVELRWLLWGDLCLPWGHCALEFYPERQETSGLPPPQPMVELGPTYHSTVLFACAVTTLITLYCNCLFFSLSTTLWAPWDQGQGLFLWTTMPSQRPGT
jgi:hypothetical protein